MSGDIGDVNNSQGSLYTNSLSASAAIQQQLRSTAGEDAISMRCENCQLSSDHRLTLLTCLHVVCKQCAANCFSLPYTGNPKTVSSNETGLCVVCGQKSRISDDFLFSNLVDKMEETNRMLDEFDICANCESRNMIEDLQFCKVCRERLCNECRILTHSAKMFSSHIFETNLLPRVEVIPCCNHPQRNAVIANLIQNNFVCVDCFSNFDEDSKSSCVEFNSAISTRTALVSDFLRGLKTQRPQIEDRLAEVERMFVDLQKTHERKSKDISNFADKLVREIRLVENQMLKQLEKDLKVNENTVCELRNKVSFFGSSLGLYSNLFGIMTSSYPDENFLTWTSEIQDRLLKMRSLKSQCLAMKLVNVPELGADFKGVFKKVLFEIFRNDAVSPGSVSNVDPFQLQNLASIRSLSTTPVNIQKILAYRGMTHGLDLSAMKLASPKNESINSSRSSSSSNNKLCPQVEEIRKKFKNLGYVFANNARKIQSLQLDVTRRKVYPKRQEAESLSLDIEKFLKTSDELMKETKALLVSILEISHSAANVDTTSLHFDKEYNIDKCRNILLEIGSLKQKHERIRQILKSIKPYICSVTLQKEKSSCSFVPSIHSDYMDDLKRNVVVTEQVTEQRIHAIEAMYKNQSAEKSSSVNNSEIHKELQLTKQKLKKARVLSYKDVSDLNQDSSESTCD